MIAKSEHDRMPFHLDLASLIGRRAAWLGLACLLPIAAGCQAMPRQQKVKSDQTGQEIHRPPRTGPPPRMEGQVRGGGERVPEGARRLHAARRYRPRPEI